MSVSSLKLSRFLFLIVGLTLGWVSWAGERGPLIPKAHGERCVAETDFMRRNHMDLIIHQRDDTVVRGIRDEPFSLVECVDCHAQKDANNKPIRVDAKEQFCASCHDYVAVKIDCFGCHAAVPDSAAVGDNGNQQTVDGAYWLPHMQLLAFRLPVSAALNHSLEYDRDGPHRIKSE